MPRLVRPDPTHRAANAEILRGLPLPDSDESTVCFADAPLHRVFDCDRAQRTARTSGQFRALHESTGSAAKGRHRLRMTEFVTCRAPSGTDEVARSAKSFELRAEDLEGDNGRRFELRTSSQVGRCRVPVERAAGGKPSRTPPADGGAPATFDLRRSGLGGKDAAASSAGRYAGP